MFFHSGTMTGAEETKQNIPETLSEKIFASVLLK